MNHITAAEFFIRSAGYLSISPCIIYFINADGKHESRKQSRVALQVIPCCTICPRQQKKREKEKKRKRFTRYSGPCLVYTYITHSKILGQFQQPAEQCTLVNVRLVHVNLRRCTYLWPSSSHGRLESALKKEKGKNEKGGRGEWKKFKCGRNESYITRSRQSKAIKCYPYSPRLPLRKIALSISPRRNARFSQSFAFYQRTSIPRTYIERVATLTREDSLARKDRLIGEKEILSNPSSGYVKISMFVHKNIYDCTRVFFRCVLRSTQS